MMWVLDGCFGGVASTACDGDRGSTPDTRVFFRSFRFVFFDFKEFDLIATWTPAPQPAFRCRFLRFSHNSRRGWDAEKWAAMCVNIGLKCWRPR
jgi:hypothetical protein